MNELSHIIKSGELGGMFSLFEMIDHEEYGLYPKKVCALSVDPKVAVQMAVEKTGIDADEFGLLNGGEKLKRGVKFPFGKHKGTLIKDVPLSYLTWVLKQDWVDEKHKTLKSKIGKIDGIIEKIIEEEERLKKAQDKKGWVGEKNKTQTIELTLTEFTVTQYYKSSYPQKDLVCLVVFHDENGNKTKYEGTCDAVSSIYYNRNNKNYVGKKVTIRGRLDHHEYKGWKYTSLSRWKIVA